jgi:hypothetical protein
MANKPIRLRWYHKVFMLGFGLILAVGITEFVGHHYHLIPGLADEEYEIVARRIGPMLKPYDRFSNTGFLPGNTEFEVDVRLNKLGFRGSDFPKQPPDRTSRIVLMGDSYTAGWEVETEEMWSGWLDQHLNHDQKRYDVANIGFPGWGTDREYLLYQVYGRQLNADLVILSVYVENDVNESGITMWVSDEVLRSERTYFTLDSTGKLVEHPWNYIDRTRTYWDQAFPKNIVGWLNANSLSYRLVRDGVRSVWHSVTGKEQSQAAASSWDWRSEYAHPVQIPLTEEVFFTQPDEKWETAWQTTEAILTAYRDAVLADGAELLVVLIPPHVIVQEDTWRYTALFEQSGREWDLWYPQKRMLALLDKLNIPVLNPTQTFIDLKAQTGENPFYSLDGHFNSTGTCWFGTVLSNWLVEQGYVQAGSPFPYNPMEVCRR